MSTASTQRLLATRRDSRAFVGVAIVAVAFAGSLALLGHGGIAPSKPGLRELDSVGVILAAFSTLPLLAWRRAPLGVFMVTATAGVLLSAFGYPADLMLGPTAALYLLTVSRGGKNPWTRRTTFALVAMFLAYLGATASAKEGLPGIEFLHTGLAWAVAWFAGERRRRQMEELEESTRRAEREAERERLLAVAEERARIARDLHDSAGHAISVIAVRAGGARLRHEQDPDRSLAALAEVEELARNTVAEIDQIVGTLRDGSSSNGAATAPIGLASLESLIASDLSAGLDVELVVLGAPQRLSGPADRAAYRILQEALTNAARHGTGHAQVELSYGEEVLEFSVTNPASGGGLPRPGGGHGLIGMRERALLLGGELDAGQADGTFIVRARLPYEGPSV